MKRVTRILFVCHGNICRSVMAEYIFKHLALQAGLEDRFEVASAAVSTEEIGNDIYPPAKLKLREHGIPYGHHAAHQITQQEYDTYDKIICFDYSNLRWLADCVSLDYDDVMDYYDTDHHVSLMMQWAGEDRDVSDPWYTRNFESAYQDILRACQGIIETYKRELEWEKMDKR